MASDSPHPNPPPQAGEGVQLHAINLPMDVLFGKAPKMHRDTRRPPAPRWPELRTEMLDLHSAGLRVLALSMLTNMGCGLEEEAVSHTHTLAVAGQGAAAALRFVEALLPALAGEV